MIFWGGESIFPVIAVVQSVCLSEVESITASFEDGWFGSVVSEWSLYAVVLG